MSMLQEFAQAMLPIAGRTGLPFLQEAARTLVVSFGAHLSLFVQRSPQGEIAGAFRPVVAFAGDAFVEDELGAPATLVVLEARCQALSSLPAEWHVVSTDPEVGVCVLVSGPPVEPLKTALAFMATRAAAEIARTTSDARAVVERRLGRLAGKSGDLVWDWELATDRVRWSDESLTGGSVTFDEWRERLHPFDRARVLTALEELRDGARDGWDDAYRVLLRDGSSRIGEVRAALERSPGGEPLRVIGSFRDITEAKAHEQRLILAERMASMGTLAAGLAHEINNPLAYVKGNVEHVLGELRDEPAVDPDLVSALEEAREGAERIRRIVQDLRLFSRPQDEAIGPVDVDRVVEGALAIVASDIQRRARLEKVLRRPPPVEGNDARLGHVVLALFVNAIHALREAAPEASFVRVETGVDDRGRVFLVVADSGAGIPAENIGRVFDPFFTTKAVGEGTGLGLAIAHSIVSSVGGEITVDSTPGAGSAFRVVLRAMPS